MFLSLFLLVLQVIIDLMVYMICMQTKQLFSPQTPTLEHVEAWVFTHVTRPIKGFEHKRNHDGSLFTKRQQLSATRLQVLAVAMYFLGRGKSEEEVIRLLRIFL